MEDKYFLNYDSVSEFFEFVDGFTTPWIKISRYETPTQKQKYVINTNPNGVLQELQFI